MAFTDAYFPAMAWVGPRESCRRGLRAATSGEVAGRVGERPEASGPDIVRTSLGQSRRPRLGRRLDLRWEGPRRLSAARRMKVVDPFDRIRIRLDVRQIEIDH